jgi:hypothetical protein
MEMSERKIYTDDDFAEHVGDMVHENVSPVEEDVVEEVTDKESKAAVTDQPADEPAVEPDEAAAEAEVSDEPEAEKEQDIDAESTEAEAEADAEPALEAPDGYRWVDGRLVAEIVVDGARDEVDAEEVRKGYMRQADYTRKTQRLAEREKSVTEALADQRSLYGEIMGHDRAKEWIEEQPDVLEHLLNDPTATRRLLNNRRELEATIADLTLMRDRPEVAKAYLDSSTDPDAAATVDGAREGEQLRAEAENLTNFAYAIDEQVASFAKEEYGEEMSQEDVDSVLTYLSSSVGGFDQKSDPNVILTGLKRLGHVLVNPQGTDWDMTLVRDRFEAIKAQRTQAEAAEKSAVDEHNEAVDAELSEQSGRAPATPAGEGAAAEAEKSVKRESLEDVLGAIRGD